ncbi:hypothetical protein NUW58_g9480 [Xylaria curta]|uniref:Uncharacterized protein n=1 Tax=Xylaria curta TaxID=42375 RepID=A0ACC1MW12_9PEZI|nr:hypothetical protein NUW58_g9480 [Xylaria curta]
MDSCRPRWAWVNLEALAISIIRTIGINTKKPLKRAANRLVAQDINKSLYHRKIGHGIRQFTAPDARIGATHDENINRSVLALADPGSLRIYFGSALYLGFRTTEYNGATKIYYEDTSPRDLRMIIEWYHTRPENPFISKRHRLPIKSYGQPGEEAFLWQAVKVHCDGDLSHLSKLSSQELNPGEDVQVWHKDVLKNRTECTFVAMAELPWVVQPCYGVYDPITDKDNIALLYNKIGRTYAPQEPRAFHAWNMDNAAGWLLDRYLPSTFCGSILVINKDGYFIDSYHVYCFHEFVEDCFTNARSRFHYDDQEANNRRLLVEKTELDRLITKKNFEMFWLKWIKQEVRDQAVAFPSPYNTTYVAESDPPSLTAEEAEEMRKNEERELLAHLA